MQTHKFDVAQKKMRNIL